MQNALCFYFYDFAILYLLWRHFKQWYDNCFRYLVSIFAFQCKMKSEIVKGKLKEQCLSIISKRKDGVLYNSYYILEAQIRYLNHLAILNGIKLTVKCLMTLWWVVSSLGAGRSMGKHL